MSSRESFAIFVVPVAGRGMGGLSLLLLWSARRRKSDDDDGLATAIFFWRLTAQTSKRASASELPAACRCLLQ